jgi:hypothetical protein
LCTSSQQAGAGTAVQAFIGGWSSELHLSGYLAGAYGNPKPAQTDFANAGTIPDDVWIAKTPASGQPPSVTVWNLTPLTDVPWPSNQRLHQFLIGQSGANWGGQSLNENMDYDIDNATIANANNGAKTASSYTFKSYEYPGSMYTWATGINDLWNDAFITNSGNVGEIVGFFTDSSNNNHGFLFDGLVAWTQIDYPGASQTYATAINNIGVVAGTWIDPAGNAHGFTWNSNTGTFVSLDYPGASTTEAWGINDAGQVVGWYYPSGGYQYGFLYYGSKFYSINYPGTSGVTEVFGINGDATISGSYSSAPSSPSLNTRLRRSGQETLPHSSLQERPLPTGTVSIMTTISPELM